MTFLNVRVIKVTILEQEDLTVFVEPSHGKLDQTFLELNYGKLVQSFEQLKLWSH